jgi:subtilase family serine protease
VLPRPFKRALTIMATFGLGTAAAIGPGLGTAATVARVVPIPSVTGHIVWQTLSFPPTTSQCLALLGIRCYQPAQFAKAYNLNGLHAEGIDGRGKTILIVDAFGSPTLAHDLHVFDTTFGLPDPPSLVVRQDAGPVPAYDPTNSDMSGWAVETTLDVEYAHVFAPGAKIVVEATPVSETEGVQGFPEIVKAENYAINHHIGDVISQSFGATELTFPNAQSLLALRGSFLNAQRHNVTVLGASGDLGATDYELNISDIYPYRVNSWPSSDPLVTSIGGTQLTLNDNGNRLKPDVVWNDGFGAGGGGVSAVFGRPDFQNNVRKVVGNHRGTPDISLSAAVDGGAVMYWSFSPRPGYHIVGGTSEASPEFAGIVAMADQVAGQRLGNINSALYQLGQKRAEGIVDVTIGNNTFGPFTNSDGTTHTVIGFNATRGYDLASGWGTLDAAEFVPELARTASEGDNQQN